MTKRPPWDDVPEPDATLTKRELSELTGLPPKRIDALTRAGMPSNPGATSRAPSTFNLKAVVGWLADDQRAAESDPLVLAKQRKALAEAERLEIQNKKIAGSIIDKDFVQSEIARNIAELRSTLLQIPLRLTAQSEQIRDSVRAEIEAGINRMTLGELTP